MLETAFLGNSLARWLVAGGVTALMIFGLWAAKKLLQKKLQGWAPQSRRAWDDALLEAVEGTKRLFVTIFSLYVGSRVLTLPPRFEAIATKVFFVALLIQIAIWSAALITFYVQHLVEEEPNDGARKMTVKAIGFLGKLVFFSLILLWGLDNLGVNITTLVAGLGISGIAVALATQNILSDLFASLSIVLDKPFVIGDFIVVDQDMGTIENIGFKTTRVRALSGEQLVFPNNSLLQSRIHNYKRMDERRVQFAFGVSYETPLETLRSIPGMVKEAVLAAGKTRFDRAHFKEFGESALTFEVVYFVLSADFNYYMDVQQTINLALFERLAAVGASIPFPTRIVHLEPTARLARLVREAPRLEEGNGETERRIERA